MNVTLMGPYRVDRALELRDTLLGLLGKGQAVVVSFAGVEDADLSFFQVLHAARRSFANRGIPLTLLTDLPAPLYPMAVRSGLA